MEKKIVFKKPKMIRRFSSALLDLLLAVVLSLLFSFIVNPIINNAYNIEKLETIRNEYVVSTKLYYLDENNELNVVYSVSKCDEYLTYFYKECLHNYDIYKEIKKESSLFINKDDDYVLDSSIDFNDDNIRTTYQTFYDNTIENTINNYLNDYLNSIDEFVNVNTKITIVLYLNILICSFIGLLITYLVIPLILKGKSIGKLCFHLKVISKASYETNPSILQLIFRGLITILFEYLLSITSIILFGIFLPISLIISIAIMLLSKYNQSFHDICCQTFLVDDFYNNENLNMSEKYTITYYNVKE